MSKQTCQTQKQLATLALKAIHELMAELRGERVVNWGIVDEACRTLETIQRRKGQT